MSNNQSNHNHNPLLASYKMFCILKKPKFSTHLFSSVLNNNAVYKDTSRVTMKGYSRLGSHEEEANGNTEFNTNIPPSSTTSCTSSSSSTFSFASFSSSASSCASSSSSSSTPSSSTAPASSTNRLCSISALGLTEPDAASIGSASVVESSSEHDIYMSQTDDDEEDDDESDDDDDEALTCNVCDRSFPTTRHLATHQTRKRHYGCSTCENVFPTLMSLEFHKEETKHWSDENSFLESENDDDGDDFYDDEDDAEREKLL